MGNHGQVKTTLKTKQSFQKLWEFQQLACAHVLGALQNCQAKCDSQISVEFSEFLSEDMLCLGKFQSDPSAEREAPSWTWSEGIKNLNFSVKLMGGV